MKKRSRLWALLIGISLPLLVYGGLESVTHIQDLNASWPLGSDLASTSDDHIRNIKSALKTDFPNFNGTYNSASAPVFAIPNDTNTGMYGPSADTLGWATGGTQRGTVNSTGNWTINAPSNGTALTVNGLTTNPIATFTGPGDVTSSGVSFIRINDVNGNAGFFGYASSSSEFDVYNGKAGIMSLWTNGAQRLNISSAGNVTVNAPTSGNSLAVTSPSGGTAISLDTQAVSAFALRFAASSSTSAAYSMGVNGSGGTSFVIRDTLNSTDRFNITTTGLLSSYGPTAAALVDMTPDTGTFTATYTGMTATVQCTVTWTRVGKLVSLFFCAATGTSNATSFTMTGLPSAIQPSSLTQNIAMSSSQVDDSGAALGTTLVDCVVTASSGTISFRKAGNAAGWTASGLKGFAAGVTISYLLN